MSVTQSSLQAEANRMQMSVTGTVNGRQITKHPKKQSLANTPRSAKRDKTDLNPSSSNTRGKRGSHSEQGEKRARERTALIDYLTLTLPDADFLPSGEYDHDQFIDSVNRFFLSSLNLKALPTLRGGKNFYSHSWEIVDRALNPVGFVAYGGNKDTLCVNISGHGCSQIGTAGYMFIYRWLVEQGGRITRVDIAHDFFNGEYDIDDVIDWYKKDLFTTKSGKGARPNATYIDDFGSGKGKTFYVGSRQSGKVFRAYEKGKQLGDRFSEWLRFELELRNTDRDIPKDILLFDSKYLSGAYKALSIVYHEQSYIETQKKTAQISYQHLLKHCSTAYGRFLAVMSSVYDDPQDIIQALIREDKPPKRLNYATLPAVA